MQGSQKTCLKVRHYLLGGREICPGIEKGKSSGFQAYGPGDFLLKERL